jgi:hypothetical protein
MGSAKRHLGCPKMVKGNHHNEKSECVRRCTGFKAKGQCQEWAIFFFAQDTLFFSLSLLSNKQWLLIFHFMKRGKFYCTWEHLTKPYLNGHTKIYSVQEEIMLYYLLVFQRAEGVDRQRLQLVPLME